MRGRFEAPARELLHEAVVRSIFGALIEGRIAPGERLVEVELANDLNVSRSPIRQALQELNRQGIVEIVPHKGTRVAEFNSGDVDDFWRVRVALEGLAAEQAARRVTMQKQNELDRRIEQMHCALALSSWQHLIEADIAFHRTVAEASENASLILAFETMVSRIMLYIVVEKYVYPSLHGYEHAIPIHEEIRKAIIESNPGAARAAMENHIRSSALDLLQRLRGEGFAVDAKAALPIFGAAPIIR